MSANAVLFDLDNTLYPYSPCNEAGKAAARAVARELGYDVDRESFEAFYQAGRRSVKREVPGTAAAHERHLYFKHAVERRVGSPRPADALALGDAYWAAYVDEMDLFDGVERTLDRLRDDGIDVGVVTNLTTRVQLEKLAALGLEDRFDVFLTSEETGREKPGSALFTLALSRLERRPSETVMVGDDVEADVVGANAVGLETVLFDADAAEIDEPLEGRRKPDHRIDAFAELTEVVL